MGARADAPEFGAALVEARQLYGLWALAFLLASMIIGPLASVLPWLPLKAPLMYARRAVGVSALGFATLHVTAYIWSVGRRNRHEFYTPGVLWVIGLTLGLIAIADMSALGLTSRDAAVKRMGGKRWKRLHRTVYIVVWVILLHALFVGADFGLNRGPDVRGNADFGSLIGFLSITAGWLILALARRRHWSWRPNATRPEVHT
jgi:DMSO/TMAO reductase YedYZ heme-binding membrane subunit